MPQNHRGLLDHFRLDSSNIHYWSVKIDGFFRRAYRDDEAIPRRLVVTSDVLSLSPPAAHRIDNYFPRASKSRGISSPPVRVQ